MAAAARRASQSSIPSRDADRRPQARFARARTAPRYNPLAAKYRRAQSHRPRSSYRAPAAVARKQSPLSLHRLPNEFRLGLRQERIPGLAIDLLAADLQHDWNREWRDVVERFMNDSPPDAREHPAEPADIEEAGRGVGAGGAQQEVVALVLAQHVVDEVGRDRHLAARLLLPREAALDQAGDDRAIAEGALHQSRFREPGFQIIAQHVLIEQHGERELTAIDAQRHVAEAIDRERIFVGDEAERAQPRALEPAREQHAQR